MRTRLTKHLCFARNHFKAVVPAFCCLLLAFALFVAVSCSSAQQLAGAPQEEAAFANVNDRSLSADSSATQLPSKLAGSVETVDSNGIVHGTTPDGINYTVLGRGVDAAAADKVTLCAVGDQLATSMSFPVAAQYAAEEGAGDYDFYPFYQEIAPFIQSFDLRYINQETVMAGADAGYSGYPVFNSPDNMAATIAKVGFNLVNFTTNHTYDMGLAGVERSHQVWDQYPQLLIGGSYLTQEDRETVHMIERNGMTFAFLAYCYGDNNYGFGTDNMPNPYYACQFDKGLMAQDIARAKKVADAVIVSMHWGDEYSNVPNSEQYDYAAFLADQGVDLVIGTHAHAVQPVKYITGESGNTIPVVFGLSDIVSGWTITDTIFSGIFTCEFTRGTDGKITVGNLDWYPTIEWSDGGDVYVRMLKDMDEATTDENTRTPDVGDDYNYLHNEIDTMGMEIPVIM